MSNRVASFNKWPYDTTWSATPATLSAAGFYFSPSELFHDRCICFKCGVALASWEKSDVPAIEHINHSGNCEFIASYLESTDSDVIAPESTKKKLNKHDLAKCILFHERENIKTKKIKLNSLSVQKQQDLINARSIRAAFLLKLLTGYPCNTKKEEETIT